MFISYYAEKDNFHFSESKKSVSIANISMYWDDLINKADIKQNNYFVLEGKNIVATSMQINHPGDGEFESYSGNRAEITTEVFSNLVLINMTFYMQEFSFVAHCDSSRNSDYSYHIEDKKLYLTAYIRPDKIIDVVSSNIFKEQVDCFIGQLEKMPERVLRHLNLNSKPLSWNIRGLSQKYKKLTI